MAERVTEPEDKQQEPAGPHRQVDIPIRATVRAVAEAARPPPTAPTRVDLPAETSR